MRNHCSVRIFSIASSKKSKKMKLTHDLAFRFLAFTKRLC
jgi:hypothetical protein